MIAFLLPKLSATMDEGTVVSWLKPEGARLRAGEPMVELETDKAVMEVESPVDAVLAAIVAPAGTKLPVGAVLARLETTTPFVSNKQDTAPVAPPARNRLLSSPAARRLAGLHGVDIGALTGSGPHGRVRARDVLAASARPAPQPSATPMPPPQGLLPLSPMRAGIAATVLESRRTIPAFALDRWVETGAMHAARAARAPRIELETGIAITLTDLLLAAMADALATHMAILDRWDDASGRPARRPAGSVDIGLVVALPDGMVIPVLRGLGGTTLAAIGRARRDAVQRARAGRLIAADAEPAPIALSNLGRDAPDRFEAIITPGASAILAVGRQARRVIPRGDGIVIASGLTLTLSVDHRMIDGAQAASFLRTLAERIEQGAWS